MSGGRRVPVTLGTYTVDRILGWDQSNSTLYTVKKIHFFQAVRRIFVALVVEKSRLGNGTFIPARTAFLYVLVGRKKFRPQRWFYPPDEQEKPAESEQFKTLKPPKNNSMSKGIRKEG